MAWARCSACNKKLYKIDGDEDTFHLVCGECSREAINNYLYSSKLNKGNKKNVKSEEMS